MGSGVARGKGVSNNIIVTRAEFTKHYKGGGEKEVEHRREKQSVVEVHQVKCRSCRREACRGYSIAERGGRVCS